MKIHYEINLIPEIESIIDLYKSSGINRPIDEKERIKKMYTHSNLVITAWHFQMLVGISRALTDFSFCCYISDLAVREEYKSKGIGKKLIELTKDTVGDQSMLLLLASPEAMDYYPKVGLQKVENGFIIKRSR